MVKVNTNYLKLPGNYLFSDIAKKVNAYTAKNPDRSIIRLGIGDVTKPLTGSVIQALHRACLLYTSGINTRIVHTGGYGGGRGIEVLHLFRHIAQIPDVFRQGHRLFQAGTGVRGH